MTPAELLDAHPGITVLSIDFFDTLVTRSVAQPTHVFAVMEERLLSSAGEKWAGFALRRVLAERTARAVMAGTDEHADITHEDIMRCLARDMGLGPAERASLSRMERDTEIELTLPVAWGCELHGEALRRGLRVVVVSDNYMSSGHIVNIARAAGLVIDQSSVFVSCERGTMKHDGSIWPVVLEELEIEPAGILHVGDLADADGTIPARHGIATHVNPLMRVSHREPGNSSPDVLVLSRIEAHNRTSDAGTMHPVNNLASGALAVIVAGQVLDIVRRTGETTVAAVHFTSRDGYLANAVYGRVRDAMPSIPPHSYVEVSRSIMWRAMLTDVTEESIERFIGDDESLTPSRLNTRFGCALVTGTNEDEPLDAVTARAVVVSNARSVEDACAGLRARTLEHLESRGVTAPGHHLLMDLGWTGSVVADLASLVHADRGEGSTFEGRLTALYWDASRNRRTMKLHGLAMDEFGRVDDNVRLLGTIRYFETLITAPHGSVIDYAGGSAVHDPRHDQSGLGGVAWDEFERTVVDNATAIVLGAHPLVRPEEVTGAVVWATMMQVANTPTEAEVEIVGRFGHDTAIDHAGGGTPLVGAVPEGFTFEDIPAGYDDLIRHHWLQGSLCSWWSDPTTRWIADEIRKHMPPVGPQWVSA